VKNPNIANITDIDGLIAEYQQAYDNRSNGSGVPSRRDLFDSDSNY
jgi:hypothetical protein